jgi:hypothetical protein
MSRNRRSETTLDSLADRIVFPLGVQRVVKRTLKWLSSFESGGSLRKIAGSEKKSQDRQSPQSMVLPRPQNWTIKRNGFGRPPAHLCEPRTMIRAVPKPSGGEQPESIQPAEVFTWRAGQNTALPPNIAQISDHVITQLDRRMVAWRERLGKV